MASYGLRRPLHRDCTLTFFPSLVCAAVCLYETRDSAASSVLFPPHSLDPSPFPSGTLLLLADPLAGPSLIKQRLDIAIFFFLAIALLTLAVHLLIQHHQSFHHGSGSGCKHPQEELGCEPE